MTESKDIPEPFITNCGVCKKEIRLLKDPEGKAFHGDCYNKFKEGKR